MNTGFVQGFDPTKCSDCLIAAKVNKKVYCPLLLSRDVTHSVLKQDDCPLEKIKWEN